LACEELPNYVNQFVDNLIIISQKFSLFQPLRKTFKPPKKKANLRQTNSGPFKNNTVLRQLKPDPGMGQPCKTDATPFFVDAAFENSFDQSRQQSISKQNQVTQAEDYSKKLSGDCGST
jgi:hypothetical protein